MVQDQIRDWGLSTLRRRLEAVQLETSVDPRTVKCLEVAETYAKGGRSLHELAIAQFNAHRAHQSAHEAAWKFETLGMCLHRLANPSERYLVRRRKLFIRDAITNAITWAPELYREWDGTIVVHHIAAVSLDLAVWLGDLDAERERQSGDPVLAVR